VICTSCAAGADLTTEPAPTIEATRALAVELHEKCKGGTWCDCQCVVVSVDELAKRRAAMPKGGLARVAGLIGA
jgi:hypothetical protein